jgi:hypothetical protein
MSRIDAAQSFEEMREAIAQMTALSRAALLELAVEGCILLDGATRAELDVIVARAVERIPAAGLAKPAPSPASAPFRREAAAGRHVLHVVPGGGSLPADAFVDDPTRAWTASELAAAMSLHPLSEPPVEGARTVVDRRGTAR